MYGRATFDLLRKRIPQPSLTNTAPMHHEMCAIASFHDRHSGDLLTAAGENYVTVDKRRPLLHRISLGRRGNAYEVAAPCAASSVCLHAQAAFAAP